MPPEYVIHGQFSIKSDVFSFGVLVLEIISGLKNTNFRSGGEDLLSFVSTSIITPSFHFIMIYFIIIIETTRYEMKKISFFKCVENQIVIRIIFVIGRHGKTGGKDRR